ncbi:MAG: hypothetical protein KKA05_05925 [Alphaproteobacteria bacterium]|nr:hypothetical protein [Alphaproteobacteria bacterium]MBU0859354.1 hypothetical protein [Alphaproteobacteria bacterium]
MNIDLLLSQSGQMGLVSDRAFDSPVAGVMFDGLTGTISLEFGDAEPLDLNIPVEQEFGARLELMLDIYVGTIEEGRITESRRVPIVLLNDPFGGGNTGHFAVKPGRALAAFEHFLKSCVSGQPLHRDDLGDEGSAGGVMGGMNPAVLQFSPQLARQRALEAAQRAVPTAAPSAPGFGPKGMGGGSSNPVRRAPPPVQRRPPDEDDNY